MAYIYFDYKNEEVQTGNYVIRTVLKQLLLPLDWVPFSLETVYDDCHSHSRTPDRVVLVQQLLSVAAAFSSVYVMLDALDESSRGTLEDTITLINQFKNSGIKVFCTFRPILDALGDRLGVPIIHSISAYDADVRNYLSIRLNKEWRHNKQFL